MNYHNITKDDMLNGDGLRVVLWCAGCGHHCPGCQNPSTWDKNDGLLFDKAAVSEIFEQLNKPYISGITLSGGDPLYEANRGTMTRLAAEIKEKYPDKTIWCYTGFTYEQVQDLPIMQYIDVLVDGRYVESLRDVNLHWKGSSNQRVIDVPKTRELGRIFLHDTNDYEKTTDIEKPCGCESEADKQDCFVR